MILHAFGVHAGTTCVVMRCASPCKVVLQGVAARDLNLDFRGPEDYISLRILHAGSKGQDKRNARSRGL